jgi:hypothetical protein
MHIVIGMHGQSKLFDVIYAVSPPRRLTGSLDRRQQERNQHANDGDYDEELN